MKRALGVCYYPEHWPEEIWARDAAEMVAAGISWVRIGEFAWSRIEPEPGVFAFDWLDRAIGVLSGAGLKIILGTPTCTPPRWMLTRFPDMLAVDAQGHPRGFGSRRHYCFSHAGYREASGQIAEILGDRYGRDPRIHGWQIDNEYGCHDTIISYSEAARQAACVSTMTYNEYWQVIDAGLTPDDLTVFKYEDQGVATLEDGLYVLEENLEDPAFEDKMVRFVRASMKGWKYAEANPDEAAEIVLDNDASGAQTEEHQKRMMGEIAKLTAGSTGALDPADYERTVASLLSGGSDPVITKAPEGAWTHVITDQALD